MANNGVKITAPLNTDDVSTVLGVASHDVGTLCTSDRINKWSKFKPIRDPRVWIFIDGTTDGVRNNAVTQMYMGVDASEANGIGSFGLNIVAHSSLADLIDDTKTAHDWEYLKPTGTKSLAGATLTNGNLMTPYRLTDFDKYHHGAASPFGTELNLPAAVAYNINSQFDASMGAYHRIPSTTATNDDTAGSIEPAWLTAPCTKPDSTGTPASGTYGPKFSEMYFGVAAYKKNSSTNKWEAVWCMTSDTPGSMEAKALKLTTNSFGVINKGDTLLMVPFLSNIKIRSLNKHNNTLARYCILPDVGKTTVRVGDEVDAAGISILITGSQIGGAGNPVLYQVSVTSNRANTLNNNVVRLIAADGLSHNLGDMNLGTLTFAKDETKFFKGTFSYNTNWASYPPVQVEVSLQGGMYIRSAFFKASVSPDFGLVEFP